MQEISLLFYITQDFLQSLKFYLKRILHSQIFLNF